MVKAVGQGRIALDFYQDAYEKDRNEEESHRLPGGFVSYCATIRPRSPDRIVIPF